MAGGLVGAEVVLADARARGVRRRAALVGVVGLCAVSRWWQRRITSVSWPKAAPARATARPAHLRRLPPATRASQHGCTGDLGKSHSGAATHAFTRRLGKRTHQLYLPVAVVRRRRPRLSEHQWVQRSRIRRCTKRRKPHPRCTSGRGEPDWGCSIASLPSAVVGSQVEASAR
jgi:hypothetical protein